MILRILLISALMVFCINAYGQIPAVKGSEAEAAYNETYNKNIKLTKIRGIYIPGSLAEAHKRLSKLTPPDAIAKFKSAPEKEVCPKLHFGIGRWMITNWNFYEGSRISHVLKEKGVLHPDDMAQFLLRTYHRHLNQRPLDEDALVTEFAKERKKVADKVMGR